MEVHAVSGGWVLEWSGTSSSICKATLGVAGFCVLAGTVVGTVKKHRHHRYSLQEPDESKQKQKTTTEERKREGVTMATAMASELPPLDVGVANSPRSRVGRGLESIGGMTESTFQRLTTVVGGVVKSPGVLMAKVGGLASPRAALSLASPTSSLEERVFQLEIQMKRLEEKYNAKTVVTEPKEKPHAARSLLQEMETEGTLVKRVQMLENRFNERMESIEKTLSSIQSQLNTLVHFKPDYQRQDSQDEEYHDAEQQSDNFETLSPRSTGASSTLLKEALQEPAHGKSVLEPQPVESKAVPAPVSVPGDDGGTSSSSERQLASTLEELHESFVTEPSAAAASAKFLELARSLPPASSSEVVPSANSEEDASDKSEEPAGVKESLAEPAQELAIQDGKDMAQVAFRFVEEPSAAAVPSAKFEEDAVHKTGTAAESDKTQEDFVMEPLAAGPAQEPPTQEDSSGDSEPQVAHKFVEEPSAVLPSAGSEELAQELAAQEGSGMALASSEPQVASKSVEEPSVVVPSAGFEESAQEDEDADDKSVTVMAAAESPLASSSEEIQEDSGKEPLAAAPSAEPAQELTVQEDSGMALASSEPQVSSKSVDEPSAIVPSAEFGESAQEDEDAADKSATMNAESPLASSLEEDFVKHPLAAAPSAEPAQELTAQEDSGMALASPEPQVSSKSVEEPSAVIPSADFGESAQEDADAADQSATMNAESPLASSLEEPQEDSAKEPLAAAPSAEPAPELVAQEDSDMALASSEPQVASKSVEEPSAVVPSAGFEEPAQENEDADDKSAAMSSESQLASSLEEDFVKEPLAAALSAERAPELATQEGSDMALASSEPQVSSKSVEEPSAVVPSAGFEEPAQAEEDADDKSATMNAESPLVSSLEEIQEDSAKDSLAAAPSAEPAQELAAQEGSDVALASSEPQVASKFVEEPSAVVPSAGFEEPAQEDDDAADKSATVMAAAESPLASSWEEIQEDSAKEPLAAAPSAEPAQELAAQEGSDVALASSEPQVASKSVEEPSAVVPSAGFEEPAQEDDDAADKSATVMEAAESPLASSLEEIQEDSAKEPLAAALNAEPVQELAAQEGSDVALASSEPQVFSKSLEEPSAVVPSAGFEEPAQAEEDADDKSATMNAESPLVSSLEEIQEDSAKDSFAAAPSAEPAQELAAQEGSDVALASSEPQVASKFVEEPSAVVPSAGFEEPAQEDDDAADKSATVMAAAESPLASSWEEIQEDSAKEPLAAAPSAEHAQELVAEEGSDVALASSESQVASKSVQEPSAVVTQEEEDAADKRGTLMAAVESPLEESQEDSVKDSLAAAPVQGLATENDEGGHSGPARASTDPQVESKFVVAPGADSEEPAQEPATQEDDVDENGKDAESPLEEIQEDSTKGSLAAELAAQEGSDMALTSSEPQVASKSVEERSAVAPGADFEEPAQEPATQEDAGRDAESPLAPSLEEDFVKEPGPAEEELVTQKDLGGKSDVELASRGPEVASELVEEPSATVQDDVVKESLAAEPSTQEDLGEKSDTALASSGPEVASTFVEDPSAPERSANFEEPAQEDSDMALASSEPQVASKFVEEPSVSADFEEPAQEDAAAADESGTMVAAVAEKSQADLAAGASAQEPDDSGNRASLEAQLASDSEVPQEAFVKESSEEPAQEKSETALPASVEESQNGTVGSVKEAEYKVAEDVKVPDEHIEDAFPRSQSDLAHAGSESLDTAEGLESKQSDEEFFDADQGSGNLESWESGDEKSFENSGVAADEPGEANPTVQSKSFVEEPLVPALSAQHAQIPEHVPEQQAAQEPTQEPEQFEQQPAQVLEQEPAQENPVPGMDFTSSEPQGASKLEPLAEEEPSAAAPSSEFEEPAQESERQPKQEPAAQEPEQFEHQPAQVPEQQSKQQPAQVPEQEPAQENPVGMDFTSSEPQVASKFEEPREPLAEEEPSAAAPSSESEEPAQESERQPKQEPAAQEPEQFEHQPAQVPEQQSKQQPAQVPEQENPVGMDFPSSERQVASKFEEPQEPLAEEEPSAAAQSSEFGEPAQEPERQPKQEEPAQEPEYPAEPGEATGISPVAQKSFTKEPLAPAPSVEPAQVPEQQSQKPTQEPEPEPAQVLEQQSQQQQQQQQPTPEPAQEEPVGMAIASSEPQVVANFEEPQEPLEFEQSTQETPLTSKPQTGSSTEKELSAPEFHDTIHHHEPVETLEQKSLDTSGTSSRPQEEEEPVTTAPTTTEPTAQEPGAGKSEDSYVSLKPQLEEPAPYLASKSVEEPSSSGELALENVVDKRLVESPLTPVVEEPEQGEIHESTEHVQIPDEHKESIEEALTTTDDAVSAQPEKKPLAHLSELFEVEDAGNNKDAPSLQESEKSVTVEEPLLSSAKMVEPEHHASKSGFARSASEPQLASKLEEHQRGTALAKGSSVITTPSAQFEHEDFVDMQCLPFRRLGESKHLVRKESDFKSVEDVKSPTPKPESYVLEPKTSTTFRSKEKRKEKKDRRRDVSSREEKESRRHSMGLEDTDRKSSLRMEPDKDGKYSARTEEKHKQTFRNWRDRLRHAFSVNKDS